jgi:hypothetical protein
MADTTNYIGVETAILEGGIRSKNFFNGRLLSAEDLRQEQEEHRKSHWRLGEATGDGVAYGFEVSINKDSTKEFPVVDVEGGLAVSRSGKILRATDVHRIALTAQGTASVNGFASFTPCEQLLGGTYKAGPGLYVLAVTSAFGSKGRAPVSGLGNTSVSCNVDNVVEGLQFRLLEVSSSISAPPGDATFRNLVAYEFFRGFDSSKESLTNPFAPPLKGYGVLDSLRDKGLSDCDVPLAFIFWSAGKGIEFVDMWSVRRRLVAKAAYKDWELSVGDRRRSDAEAAFLQFQMHLDSIRQEPDIDLPTFTADMRFKFLPPAGYLPSAFDWAAFLGPMAPFKSKPIDAGLLSSVLQRSLLMEPVRVVSFADGTKPNVDPPVPLDVYEAPFEDFVLFARSTDARIRVFYNPLPASLEGFSVVATTSSNSLALIGELSSDGHHLAISDARPGDHSIDLTAPGFVKPSPQPVEAIGGQTVDRVFVLTPLPKGSILVKVSSSDTHADLNEIVQSVSATNSQSILFPGKLEGDSWIIPDLLVDSYAVRVVAPSFKPGVAHTVAVTAGEARGVSIEIEPVETPREAPPSAVDSRLQLIAKEPVKVNLTMMFKSPRDGILDPVEHSEMFSLELDADGKAWLDEWKVYLDKLYPGNAIGVVNPRVFVPRSVVKAPSATGRLLEADLFLGEAQPGFGLKQRQTLFKPASVQQFEALALFGETALAVRMRVIRLS